MAERPGRAARRPHHAAPRRPGRRAGARHHRGRARRRRTPGRRRRHAGAACSAAAATWWSPTTGFDGTVVAGRDPRASRRRGRDAVRRARWSPSRRGSRGTPFVARAVARGLGRRRGARPASPAASARPRSRTSAPTARRSPRPSPRCAAGTARDGVQRTFAAADCGFGYRTSRFKQRPRAATSCSAVTFQLRLGDLGAPVRVRRAGPRPRRRGRASARRSAEVRDGRARAARRQGHGARRRPTTTPGAPARSSPTRSSTPTAGARRARRAWPQPDGTREDQRRLADRARRLRQGLRQRPRRRCPTKHTLALTNRGARHAPRTCWPWPARSATACDERFGIRLVNEPVLVGCELPARDASRRRSGLLASRC